MTTNAATNSGDMFMTITVSLRITSPVMPAAWIVSGVGMTPTRTWSKGDATTTPKGKPLEGVRNSSYATRYRPV